MYIRNALVAHGGRSRFPGSPAEVADGGRVDAEGFLEGVREVERVGKAAAGGDFLHQEFGVLQQGAAGVEGPRRCGDAQWKPAKVQWAG